MRISGNPGIIEIVKILFEKKKLCQSGLQNYELRIGNFAMFPRILSFWFAAGVLQIFFQSLSFAFDCFSTNLIDFA